MTDNSATKTTTYSTMTWPEQRFPEADVLFDRFNIKGNDTRREWGTQ
jgi:hypothetical protein